MLRLFLIFSTLFLSLSKMPVFAGQLDGDRLCATAQAAYLKYRNLDSGENANYIKALQAVDPKTFGISIVTADGRICEFGDYNAAVSIQSVSKVFTLALLMREKGPNFVEETIGVQPTGMPFNSVLAIENQQGSPSNPYVNAGAISTVSWLTPQNEPELWKAIKENMDSFAGKKLAVNTDVLQSEMEDNKRNLGIATLLDSYGKLGTTPLDAVTAYTKQCSVNVTSHDLAVMGSVLANDGLHPITHKQILKSDYVPHILSSMVMSGVYDNSGSWFYETGVPAKSGVGGGFIAIIPGKMSIGVISPPLDQFGNSVRAQRAVSYIINQLNLNPYAN
ncbi:glutaminase 1 [Vibrio zhanjiangensis]|uniref:Glutaminase n=1 Tax=Vibrio zhanjiangensis TaxID=1046128 RepID=A0ABQ6F4R7_9VIBR|nr:glutaminase A [Vibrio zhanjiangensis]GLT19786.1 glutaminase 1 [Vibrio zhanjiangensis]